MHIGQSIVPATPAVGQPLVIDPHQAQDRRLQIVNRYDVLYGAVSKFIGSSVPVTSSDASTWRALLPEPPQEPPPPPPPQKKTPPPPPYQFNLE